MSEPSLSESPKEFSDYNTLARHEIRKPLFGIDIGGTLTKCVYFQPINCEYDHDEVQKMTEFIKLQKLYNSKFKDGKVDAGKYEIKIKKMNGYMHFLKFQTTDVPDSLCLIKDLDINPSYFSVAASGGGAYKYADQLDDVLGHPCPKADELESLIRGIAFLQENYLNECYTFIPTESGGDPQKVVIPMKQSVYPFILVNIGSGVSILKVTSENICERVGGCPLGGGTFFGLARLLTAGLSFDDALKQASEGNKCNVDMLVKDIYGGDYTQFNLKGNVVASSFGNKILSNIMYVGKLCRCTKTEYSQSDVLASILHMITNNIGSLANLHAQNYGIKRIIYSGAFFYHNQAAMHLLSMSMRYWSAGSVKALFLEHEGYCGAVGALLSNLSNSDFNVIPNSTIDDDDKNSVDIDPTASVEEIKKYDWIYLSNSKFEGLSNENVKIESKKQSLFIQCIDPQQTCFILNERELVVIISKMKERPWPRLQLFSDNLSRKPRSQSCF